jgi:hypothetical protein
MITQTLNATVPADLLKEQRYALADTAIPQVTNPIQLQLPEVRLALAPDDHPVNPRQVQRGQRPQQRLQQQEPSLNQVRVTEGEQMPSSPARRMPRSALVPRP